MAAAERERDNRIKVYIYDAPARFTRIGAEHFGTNTHTHSNTETHIHMHALAERGKGATNTSAVKHSPDGSAQRLTELHDGQRDRQAAVCG